MKVGLTVGFVDKPDVDVPEPTCVAYALDTQVEAVGIRRILVPVTGVIAE